MLRKLLVPLLAAALCGATATVANAAGGHGPLDRVRHATARYHHLAVAEANGYGLLVDAEGIACIDMPDPPRGVRMCACITPRPGAAVALKELVEFLAA